MLGRSPWAEGPRGAAYPISQRPHPPGRAARGPSLTRFLPLPEREGGGTPPGYAKPEAGVPFLGPAPYGTRDSLSFDRVPYLFEYPFKNIQAFI